MQNPSHWTRDGQSHAPLSARKGLKVTVASAYILFRKGVPLLRYYLIILLLGMGSILLISSVGCRAGAKVALHEAFGNDCKFETQGKINWETEPTVTTDGYLVFSGKTKNGARLHQAQQPVTDLSDPDMTSVLSTVIVARIDEDERQLIPVALIWPPEMVRSLEADSEVLDIFGQPDAYSVSDDSFEIKVRLPTRIQENEDDRFAVTIWEAMSEFDPNMPPTSLDAKCIKQE